MGGALLFFDSPLVSAGPYAGEETSAQKYGRYPTRAPNVETTSPVLAPTSVATAPSAGLPGCPIPEANLRIKISTSTSTSAGCQSIWSILEASPSLSNWLGLLKRRNLEEALSSTNQSLTIFSPVNAAFDCNVFTGTAPVASTVEQLANASETSLAALVGGQVVVGTFTSEKLQPGTLLNTTDVVRKGTENAAIQIQVTPASASIQLQGVGSTTKLLKPDILACGPSVLHVTDNFLLPYNYAATQQDPSIPPMAVATDGPSGPAVRSVSLTYGNAQQGV